MSNHYIDSMNRDGFRDRTPTSLDARDATLRGREVLADAKAAQDANVARSRREAGERAKKASAGIIQKLRDGHGHPCINPVANFVPKPV